MSKKLDALVALAGIGALSLFLLSCGSSSSRPSGLLYVLTEGSNVSSFAIDLSSGNLSLINSNASTCTTSGTSCGLPLNIILDPTGATAFVLNEGVPCVQVVSCVTPCGPSPPLTPCASIPPTIYPYTVNSDGSLPSPGTPIPLSRPTSAQDTQDDADLAVAMVRDAAGQFLFVMNQGSNPPPANCQNDPLPQGNFDACPSISVFAMKPSLTLAGGSPIHPGSPLHLSRIPTALSAITFTPPGATTAQEFLFVTSSQDLTALHNDNTLSVYTVSSSGILNELTPNSPYSTNPVPLSVVAVNTNPTVPTSGGVFVYVGSQSTGPGALNVFQVCTVVGQGDCTQPDVNSELLKPVGTPTSVGQKPVGMVVDPTNKFLYVVNELSSNVYGFLINTTAGTLTALSPANLSTGSQPVALAMHSSGKFLYTSNNNASSISAFAVSTTSGSMSSLNTVNSPSGPRGMAAR